MGHAHGVEIVTAPETAPATTAQRMPSYSDAVRKAMPAVVSIFTSKEVKGPRHPFMDDPVFRHFFGDQLEDADAARRRASAPA